MEDKEETLASEPWDENDDYGYEDDDWDLRRDLDDDFGD